MNGLRRGRGLLEGVQDDVAFLVVDVPGQPDNGQFVRHGAGRTEMNRLTGGDALLSIGVQPPQIDPPVSRNRGGLLLRADILVIGASRLAFVSRQ